MVILPQFSRGGTYNPIARGHSITRGHSIASSGRSLARSQMGSIKSPLVNHEILSVSEEDIQIDLQK